MPPNSGCKAKAASRASTVRAAPEAIATPSGSRPDATGRSLFRGCARSRSTSRQSFRRYTDALRPMKTAKAATARSPSDKAPEKSSRLHAWLAEKNRGRNTSRFLLHWRGRVAAKARGKRLRSQPADWCPFVHSRVDDRGDCREASTYRVEDAGGSAVQAFPALTLSENLRYHSS